MVSALLMNSCNSTSNPPPQEPSFEDLDSDALENEGLEDITESLQNKDEYPTLHPKDLKPWSLKSLLMTEKKPEEVRLVECRKEMLAISKSLINTADLLSSQGKIFPEINQNQKLYHWCFYYGMMIVDSKLKSDALGTTLSQKIHNFHQEMKALWILATTLSKATNDPQYFNYLRQRYIKISEDHFARRLNIGQEALGETSRKPAGEVDSE